MFFKKQINDLSKKYKVITYDLRGHGDSEITNDGYTLDRYAKDLKNLIDSKLKKCYLSRLVYGNAYHF